MDKKLINWAKEFAHAAHDSIQQVRKYTGEPYWVHTDEVALIVEAHGGSDIEIVAAHLHDYREDVIPALIKQGREVEAAKFEREYYLFPEQSRWHVVELTDVYTSEAFPDVRRDTRKAQEAERISRISKGSKRIKLADLFSNTKSIVQHDPDFAKVYLREKERMMLILTGVNEELYNKVAKQLKEAQELLSKSA